MRIYKTQEEYDNEKCSLQEDILSVIIENEKVNYGVIIPHVIINGTEKYIFCDGIIPNYMIPQRPWYNYVSEITKIDIICITFIGNNAFNGCSSLTSIDIPNSVTSIGINAFRGCSSLNTLNYYGTSAPNIGNNAFNDCTNLQSINVPKDYKGDTFGSFTVNKVF